MDFLLVRHAEPAWMASGTGAANPVLTPRGHRQADRTAEFLRGVGIDELWVSPLTRAQQTAAPLAEATGLAPFTMDWLAEARPPSVDGLKPEEVKTLFGGSRRRSIAEWWAGLHDGEPLQDFVRRIANGIDGTLQGRGATRDDKVEPPLWRGVPRDGKVCVVSHAGTTAALMSHLLGLPQVPWAWERFLPRHASVTHLRTVAIADGVIFSLREFGGCEHHPNDERTL